MLFGKRDGRSTLLRSATTRVTYAATAPIIAGAIGFASLAQVPVFGQTLGDYLNPVEVTAEARVVMRTTQEWPSVPELEWNGTVECVFDGRNFLLRSTERGGSSEYVEYDLVPLSDSTDPPGVAFQYRVKSGSTVFLNARGTNQYAAPDLAIQASMPMFYWWENAHAEYHPNPKSHSVSDSAMEFTSEASPTSWKFGFEGDRPTTMQISGPTGVAVEAAFSRSLPSRP